MALAGLLKLLSHLPLPALHALGAAAGGCAARLPVRARRVAAQNVARCFPGLPHRAQQRLAGEALRETAKAFFEAAALWSWSGPRLMGLVTEVLGREHLERAVARGTGVVVVMPHLGSWELASLYGSSLQPMTTLYKRPRSPALERLMLAGRRRLGARLVPTGGAGVRALYQALARGQAVGILPDQNPTPGAGIYVPFFGHSTYTITLVGRLLQKTGAAVVYAYAERLPRGRGFRVHFRAPAAELAGLDVEQVTARINADIEACVRELPGQYQWSYPRFKFTPEELAKHLAHRRG